MNKKTSFDENNQTKTISIPLNNSCYDKVAVFQASYKFTDQCYVKIKPDEEETIVVILSLKEEGSADLSVIAKEFQNEVIDQQLRRELEKRYGNLRELIYEHAFAPIANLTDRVKDAK
ncbi:MAG: His-Xaa-Ser system protein HxsD [Candidatus Deferrimicrobium sp.]